MAHHSDPILWTMMPNEIQNSIWAFLTPPQTITFEPEGYNKSQNTSAVPWNRVVRGSPNALDPEGICSARFSTIPPCAHAALQVCHQSRETIFRLGYRPWKVYNREGHVQTLYWNPDIDTIVFPPPKAEYYAVRTPRQKSTAVKLYYWLGLFALQYPEETKIAKRIALTTSLCKLGRLQRFWVVKQIGNFTGMTELVVMVDERFEREQVANLIERGLRTDHMWGNWNLPRSIEEALSSWTPWKGESGGTAGGLKVPIVRVVRNADGITSNESLQISLRCNPCEYLGII